MARIVSKQFVLAPLDTCLMPVFNSFFMGGFECADHINRSGDRVNLHKETQHDIRAWADYQLLADVGLKTVREGVCWSSVEIKPFVYDFSEVGNRLNAAAYFGLQQVWDLCHFGYPDGIYPTHPHFCARFTALCNAFARFYKATSTQPLFVVPINEISFLAWHSGDVRGTVPFAVNCGFDIKYHLCKAAIAGIESLRSILPDCRIILVEPMINVHPCAGSNPAELATVNEAQFQAMDMIAGRMCPELGGMENNLDILGFNYYWDCQWQYHGLPLEWPEHSEALEMARKPRRIPLAGLLAAVYARYERPILLAETGHFGLGRALWLDEITSQCMTAMDDGVDLLGICLYPVIDRPDWDDLNRYHNSGIWDLDADKTRAPHAEYLAMLKACIDRMANGDSAAGLPRVRIEERPVLNNTGQ